MQLLVLALITIYTFAQDDLLIKIAPDISYVNVLHHGIRVKVMRNQDPEHLLLDDYSKTSRPCPPFCIHPIKLEGIKTIATLEMVKFMRDKVNSGRGVIVDARLPSWYKAETIPSAINIPFIVFEKIDRKKAEKIFKLLGMEVKNGHWDFSHAKEIAVFCNGVWCDQSRRLIKPMIKLGYPKEKIFWYRNGMQGWKLLGLTTVVQKVNKAK